MKNTPCEKRRHAVCRLFLRGVIFTLALVLLALLFLRKNGRLLVVYLGHSGGRTSPFPSLTPLPLGTLGELVCRLYRIDSKKAEYSRLPFTLHSWVGGGGGEGGTCRFGRGLPPSIQECNNYFEDPEKCTSVHFE